MLWHLKKGELAFEPFSGSGTAIIAAETTERRCYALTSVLTPRQRGILAVAAWVVARNPTTASIANAHPKTAPRSKLSGGRLPEGTTN